MSAFPDSHALVELPATGKTELLFLLCHGVGGDGAQMAPLAAALRAQYPQAAIVSLNGPERCDDPQCGPGWQWFSMLDRSPAVIAAQVKQALPGFVARVRQWAGHFELDWPLVALVGYSQGAIMSLEAVQAQARLAGRVIGLSGAYAWLPEAAPQDVCVHLLHGMQDEVLPYQPIVSAARELVSLGADVTADVLPGIGHAIDPRLVDKAMEQLRTFLPGKLWREAVLQAAEQDRYGGSPGKP
ncbi:MAG: esterase [Paucibacter sp.]|nr:esterase [Roseateles sp.]